MSNNRAEIWAREARLRDVIKMPRRRKLVARSLDAKRAAAYHERFEPTRAPGWKDPPFELRAGDWTVWAVWDADGTWAPMHRHLHMISAHRYSNWLNDTQGTSNVLRQHFVARVCAPEGTMSTGRQVRDRIQAGVAQ